MAYRRSRRGLAAGVPCAGEFFILTLLLKTIFGKLNYSFGKLILNLTHWTKPILLESFVVKPLYTPPRLSMACDSMRSYNRLYP